MEATVVNLAAVISAVVAILGAVFAFALWFAVLKARVKALTNSVDSLHESHMNLRHEWAIFHGNNAEGEKRYVKPDECNLRVHEMKESLNAYGISLKGVTHTVNQLDRFARWMLTQKEGLGLAEVEAILNGKDY